MVKLRGRNVHLGEGTPSIEGDLAAAIVADDEIVRDYRD